MREVAALCRFVASNDSNPDSDFHRTVYDYIEHSILPAVPSAACPPLPVLVYAIRNILQPSFVPQQIPELLRLLVHLELLRNKAVETLQSLPPARLRIDRHATLQTLLEPPRLRAGRSLYRKIIHGCCLSHIHYLWRTFDPTTDPPITTHLFAYYPAFAATDPAARADCERALKEQPFHHDITDEELAVNRQEGAGAAAFVVAAAEYTEDPKSYCSRYSHNIDQSFDEIFPPPNADDIVQAILRFLRRVTTLIDTLNDITEE